MRRVGPGFLVVLGLGLIIGLFIFGASPAQAQVCGDPLKATTYAECAPKTQTCTPEGCIPGVHPNCTCTETCGAFAKAPCVYLPTTNACAVACNSSNYCIEGDCVLLDSGGGASSPSPSPSPTPGGTSPTPPPTQPPSGDCPPYAITVGNKTYTWRKDPGYWCPDVGSGTQCSDLPWCKDCKDFSCGGWTSCKYDDTNRYCSNGQTDSCYTCKRDTLPTPTPTPTHTPTPTPTPTPTLAPPVNLTGACTSPWGPANLSWADSPNEGGYRLARNVNNLGWNNDYRRLSQNISSYTIPAGQIRARPRLKAIGLRWTKAAKAAWLRSPLPGGFSPRSTGACSPVRLQRIANAFVPNPRARVSAARG